jgi:hypothetical protein
MGTSACLGHEELTNALTGAFLASLIFAQPRCNALNGIPAPHGLFVPVFLSMSY